VANNDARWNWRCAKPARAGREASQAADQHRAGRQFVNWQNRTAFNRFLHTSHLGRSRSQSAPTDPNRRWHWPGLSCQVATRVRTLREIRIAIEVFIDMPARCLEESRFRWSPPKHWRCPLMRCATNGYGQMTIDAHPPARAGEMVWRISNQRLSDCVDAFLCRQKANGAVGLAAAARLMRIR